MRLASYVGIKVMLLDLCNKCFYCLSVIPGLTLLLLLIINLSGICRKSMPQTLDTTEEFGDRVEMAKVIQLFFV